MIKTLVSFLLVAICFSACENKTGDAAASVSDSTKTEKNRKITKRDITINASNSYNDLFFDSMLLVKFISDNKIADSIARRMTSFYNARNYQYAWFASNGLTEQARSFWNMLNYHTVYSNDSSLNDKSLRKNMNDLVAEEELAVTTDDKNIFSAELKLTQHFILFALNNIEDGYLKRKELERFIPFKKQDAMNLADSVLTKKHKDNKYYEDVNEAYKKLKIELQKYYDIAKNGDWPVINASPKDFKTGASSPAVLQLKKRLQMSGDMPADTTLIYNDVLVSGIKSFQVRHGYTPNGILTDVMIKDMNIPARQRVQQILINMGRMQWMNDQPKGQLIIVNIPEFILHVKDGDQKVFDMNVVVGKEGHNTTIFTGNLNQVVFSPYWNVPVSIVKKEILPAMDKDPNYLASHHMEITGTEGGVPAIRQLPGGDNSLGKVKFLFPNSFDIYFHDTPAKALFSKDKRAYSHGCIRLSEPVKMAEYLLKDSPEWTPESIDEAMNSTTEKHVSIKKPVPVLITYYTAWVDDNGQLHFADDIYSHDAGLANKMFL